MIDQCLICQYSNYTLNNKSLLTLIGVLFTLTCRYKPTNIYFEKIPYSLLPVFPIVIFDQGYNTRKVNCSCVYSAYIFKPVFSGRNL